MGIFFAAGWSPCIGATLGAILTMGLSQQTVGQAMWLASGYSLGLGIPFLAMALGLERATGWIKTCKPLPPCDSNRQWRVHDHDWDSVLHEYDEFDRDLGIQEWILCGEVRALCCRADLFHRYPGGPVVLPFALCSAACPCLSRLFEWTYISKGISHEKDFFSSAYNDSVCKLPVKTCHR